MSKEFKNIDQLFQSELSGVQAKAPAHVKGNIDKAIGTGKRRGLWFFLIPILLIGISVPAAIMLTNPADESSEIIADNSNNQGEESGDHSLTHDADNQISENAISNETDANTLIDQQLNDSQNNSSFSNNSNSHENLHSNNSLNTIQSNSNSYNSHNTNSSNEELNSENNNRNQTNNTESNENVSTEESSSNEETTSNNEQVENNSGNEEVVDTNSSENENNESESSNEEISDKNTTTTNEEESSENNTTEENTENNSNEESTENDHEEVENNTNEEVTENSENEEESNEESTENTETEDQTSTDTTAQETNDPDHNLDPKTEEEKRWMISVLGGGAFKNSNIITGNDTLDAEYGQLNDRPGFGVGVDVNYRLRNGLMFGAGVAYSSQSETYDFQKSITSISDSTISWNVFVTDSIVDSLGTTYIYDSTQTVDYTYATQDLYNQQGTNKTSYLHIPFRFGFQYLFKQKWRFDAYAQGRFNLLLNTNAVFVQNDALVTSTLKNSYFDLEIGGGVHYKLWKNLYVSGVFRYRPPLRNPYYAPTIQNKMQYLYVGAGVSLTF